MSLAILCTGLLFAHNWLCHRWALDDLERQRMYMATHRADVLRATEELAAIRGNKDE